MSRFMGPGGSGSFAGDIDTGIDIDLDMDMDSNVLFSGTKPGM